MNEKAYRIQVVDESRKALGNRIFSIRAVELTNLSPNNYSFSHGKTDAQGYLYPQYDDLIMISDVKYIFADDCTLQILLNLEGFFTAKKTDRGEYEIVVIED